LCPVIISLEKEELNSLVIIRGQKGYIHLKKGIERSTYINISRIGKIKTVNA